MLDLDHLAQKCAKNLNQQEEKWRTALWSVAFQNISASMTDGEVETFLINCPSPSHVDAALKFLNGHPDAARLSPFALLLEQANNADLPLGDWIRSLPASVGHGS